MKVNAISYQNFTGKKANKIKTAAAAMAIAASPLAVQEADAQIFVQPIYPYNVRVMPTVPNSFVVGNLGNFNLNKSMKQVFDELDINQNGVISSKEVVRTEANNWNRFNYIPYDSYQALNTYNKFNTLSALYNEDDSNSETINYNEYKEIMNDYIETNQLNSFMGLMQMFMRPYYHYHPYHHHPSPPHHFAPPHHPHRH